MPKATRRAAPDPDEVRALAPEVQDALRALSAELLEVRAELARVRARLAEAERLADRDPLTGLLNRRGFGRELRRAAAEASRHGVRAAVAYIDLDDFKSVNDTLGHRAGDAALTHVAALLLAHVRETDTVARLGGDEFAVLLSHADPSSACAKAASLERLVADAPFTYSGRAIRLSASSGVCALVPGEAPEAVLAEADRAMFAAKRARKLRAVG